MKNLIALLAFIMMSQANAQAPNAVIVTLPDSQPSQAQAQAQSEATATAVAAPAAQPQSAPIYILNNQRLQGYQGVQQTAVQDQPTTVIVDAPVKVSVSESIRKQRAETEAGTEDGIVQALEKARLEDELRRREKFNSALAPAQQAVIVQQATVSQGTVVQQAAVQQVNAAPVVIVEEEEAPKPRRKKVVLEERDEDVDVKVDVKAEIRAALAEKEAAKADKHATEFYVAGLVGMGVYPDAEYIKSGLATGFTLGMVTPERFVIEGAFSYADYTIGDDFSCCGSIDMAQYDFSAAMKYQIFSGKIRPAVGAVATYSRRSYTSPYSSYYNAEEATTDSLNAGLMAGLDVGLTKNFSVGVDFRYLWSIASRDNSNPYSNGSFQTSGTGSIEDMAYYMTSVAAKFSF